MEFTPELSEAKAKILREDGSLFVTGGAGTGKSTLLRHVRDLMDPTPVVLAPTGVAAINVDGQTIHRFFGFEIGVTPEKIRTGPRRLRDPDIFTRLRTIIIDEVSMVRADLIDCIDEFLQRYGPLPRQPFGGVQMVYFGDLFQLPPIVKAGEKRIFSEIYDTPYFFSAPGVAGSALDVIKLRKVFRQKDTAFTDLLNRFRNNKVEDRDIELLNTRVDPHFDPPPGEMYVALAATNKHVDAVNNARLAALDAEPSTSVAEVTGEFGREHFPAPETLRFAPGAQIMMLNNDSSERWVNGTIGRVLAVDSSREGPMTVSVALGNGSEVEVELHEWKLGRYSLVRGEIEYETIGSFKQLPFRLAWAVTVHKGQGATFDRMTVDLDRVFSPGQAYVALSRCTSLEGIVLTKPISKRFAWTDYRVHRFFSEHESGIKEPRLTQSKAVDMLEEAISKKRAVNVVYLGRRDEPSKRTLVPIKVGPMKYGQTEYVGLTAYCRLSERDLTFRVDRIAKMELADR